MLGISGTLNRNKPFRLLQVYGVKTIITVWKGNSMDQWEIIIQDQCLPSQGVKYYPTKECSIVSRFTIDCVDWDYLHVKFNIFVIIHVEMSSEVDITHYKCIFVNAWVILIYRSRQLVGSYFYSLCYSHLFRPVNETLRSWWAFKCIGIIWTPLVTQPKIQPCATFGGIKTSFKICQWGNYGLEFCCNSELNCCKILQGLYLETSVSSCWIG